MSDYLKRIFGQLVAGLLAYASRLARLAALRQLLDESTAVLEEAAHLEAKGQPQLARYLRAELNDTLSDVRAADAVPQPSLNGGGNHDPFALPRPDTTANQPAGEGSAQPRRGRRPGKNGAKRADDQPPPPQEQAAPQSDPTVAPDHHL